MTYVLILKKYIYIYKDLLILLVCFIIIIFYIILSTFQVNKYLR